MTQSADPGISGRLLRSAGGENHSTVFGCHGTSREQLQPHHFLGNHDALFQIRAPESRRELWRQAEALVKDESPKKLWRVRQGHLPVLFCWLNDWRNLRGECWEQNAEWPVDKLRGAEEFWKICAGVPGRIGTTVRVLSEGGELRDDFLKQFAVDFPYYTGSSAGEATEQSAAAQRIQPF